MRCLLPAPSSLDGRKVNDTSPSAGDATDSTTNTPETDVIAAISPTPVQPLRVHVPRSTDEINVNRPEGVSVSVNSTSVAVVAALLLLLIVIANVDCWVPLTIDGVTLSTVSTSSVNIFILKTTNHTATNTANHLWHRQYYQQQHFEQ